MKPTYRGLVLAALHIALVLSLGAKLLVDRAMRPRVWARAAPYDPDLPIRGRYVSLMLEVQTKNLAPPVVTRSQVVLAVENNQLVASPDPAADGYDPAAHHVWLRQRGEATVAVLQERVAFFIPEHIPDPSRRPPGEELWVEVTVPKKGPPRPIRLGVKQKGALSPLNLD